MKTTHATYALAALALLSTLNSQLSTCFAQGSLTPPGAPGPTMRTLTQIEPRTPISTAPFIITNAGSYYLTTNLTVATGNAITIATNGVTLDLGGFTIASTAPSATGYGILINSGQRNLTIVNGFIQGGVTNDAGIYSGPGFYYGIYYSGTAPRNTRVAGVSVSGCMFYGIYLAKGESTVVESCTVRTLGTYGITASTIKSSVAVECGSNAINGEQVSDSRGECTGTGSGVLAITAQNCYGSSTSGAGIIAYTAQNCFGSSSGDSRGVYTYYIAQNCYGYSSSGTGLEAGFTALNCYGYSSSGGPGLSASSAENCYGYSSSGTGLEAGFTALNCRGQSNTGKGLSAITAQNCYGESSSSFGLYVNTAQNCYGECTSGSGTGLAASIAIGCRGSSSSGAGLSTYIANSCMGSSVSALYKYNMP